MSTDRTGSIVTGFAVILGFQGLGSLIQLVLGLQIPGPVLGFFLMWAAISARWLPVQSVEAAADLLLNNLLLLFTPVVVGLLPYLPQLQDNALVLCAAVVAGTIATVIVTGHTTQWLLARTSRQQASRKSQTSESGRTI